ncbi:MAG: hypothetical protein OEW08_15120, partial [Gammaproteobacteria bacterium]|nr:hypothetical protein [Gammaproteobacteria bacterium]
LTAAPGANYGFLGADVKSRLFDEMAFGVLLAARAKYVGLMGPQDLSAHQGGVDFIASKTFGLVTPYVGVSGLFTRVAETTDKVNLKPEYDWAGVFSLGGEIDWKFINVGLEANIAPVNTYKVKIGAQF